MDSKVFNIRQLTQVEYVITDLVCGFRISSSNIYQCNIYISKYPTQNCQLSSIGLMDGLLGITNSEKVVIQFILRECYRIIEHKPNLILVDVKNQWIASVEKCFRY